MAQAKRKSNAGRPTGFKKEFVAQAEKLCELGATDFELAEFFEINEVTLWRWKNQFPQFCKAVKVGKDLADDRVESSLYHRAVGYKFHSEKVMSFQGEIIRAPIIEHVPPDVPAAMNWLKNRRPDTWRERNDVNVNLHVTLAELVNKSYAADLPGLPEPKVIEHEE